MKSFILIKFNWNLKKEKTKFSSPFHSSSFSRNLTWALALLVSTACPAFAADVSQSFTYQGRFYNSTGTAPLSDVVDLILGVYDPNGVCLLYEETQNNIDLTTTNGLFAIQVGSAVGASQRTGSDPTLTMAKVFTNSGTQIRAAAGTCPAGYTPSASDSRVLRVTVTPHTTLVPSTLVPDQIIGSQTTSLVAQTLQGLASGDFIQSAAGVAGQAGVSLATLTTLTGGSSTDASALHNHDSLYVKLSGGGSTSNLGSGIAYTTGTLGVGTAVPTADIGLGGTTARTIQVERNSIANNAGHNLILLAGGATSGGTDQSGGNLILSSGTSTGAGSSGIQFNTAAAGTAGTSDRAPSTKMTLTADGRLGVGTANPGAQVEIDASGSAIKGQIIQGAASQSSNLLEFQNSTSSVLSYFDAAGYLTLPGDPTSALQPATKQYVTGLLSSGAVTSFNTRTGAITLASSDVSTALGYTPLNQAGDTLIGPLILAANPTSALGAATQQYVTGLLAGKQDTGSYLTALTGDVTAAGSGSVAATVATVGGSSAANIHTAELAANAATANNTASKIVARDPSGNFIASTVTASLIGNVAGNVTGNLTGSVTGNVLGNVTGDVSGNVTGSAAGNVLKAGDTMTGLLVLSANPSDNFGAVTKKYVDDINTSLNAAITGTTSSLTLTFTPPLVNTAGNVAMAIGSTSSDGYLSSTDWMTFNNKQSSLGYSPVNRAGDTVSGLLTLNSSGTSLTTLGNVGIGTLTPAYTLDVAGSFRATGTLTATSFSGSGSSLTGVSASNISSGTLSNSYTTATSANTNSAIVSRDAAGNFTASTITATAFSGPLTGNVTGAASLNVLKTGDVMSGVLNLNATGTALTTVGNVGIGTAAPSYNLDVSGSTRASSFYIGTNNVYINTTTPGANAGSFDMTFHMPQGTVNSNGNGGFNFVDSSNNSYLMVSNDAATGIAAVGIGTATPAGPLDVEGGTYWSTGGSAHPIKLIGQGGSQSCAGGGLCTGGNIIIQAGAAGSNSSSNGNIQLLAGNVGIGMSAPGTKLEVQDSTSNLAILRIRENSTNTATDGGGELQLYGTRSAGGGVGAYATLLGGRSNNASNNAGYFSIAVSSADGLTPVERLRIVESGNVGIGTTNPISTLDVTRTTSGNALTLRNNQTGVSNNVGLRFSLADTTVSDDTYSKAGIFYVGNGVGSGLGSMQFALNSVVDGSNVGTSNSVMTLLNSGNVGIGTVTPNNTLEVNGTAIIRQSITSGTYTSSVIANGGTFSVTVSSFTPSAIVGAYLVRCNRSSAANSYAVGVFYNWNPNIQSVNTLISNNVTFSVSGGSLVVTNNTGSSDTFSCSILAF
jgi:hypothetical protein